MADSSERFPLFPLGLVLLPGEVVPLHIFEERYKTMIDECLDQGTEFGIVWSGDDGVRDVGCAAEVAQLIERTEDGRMNILAKGTRRFTLERRIEDMPYPAGDVTWTEDTDPAEGAAGSRRPQGVRGPGRAGHRHPARGVGPDRAGRIRDGVDDRVRRRREAGAAGAADRGRAAGDAGPAVHDRAGEPRRAPRRPPSGPPPTARCTTTREPRVYRRVSFPPSSGDESVGRSQP